MRGLHTRAGAGTVYPALALSLFFQAGCKREAPNRTPEKPESMPDKVNTEFGRMRVQDDSEKKKD